MTKEELELENKTLKETLYETKLNLDSLSTHGQKMSYALKIFMANTSLSQEDSIKVVENFDKASNLEEIIDIYKKWKK